MALQVPHVPLNVSLLNSSQSGA